MKKSLLALLVGSLGLSACTTVDPHIVRTEQDNMLAAKAREAKPVVIAEEPVVIEHAASFIPVKSKTEVQSAWLKTQMVSLKITNPVPLTEVIKSLAKQGLNITSELPLDRYTYSGFQMNETDAESALRLILGSVGLDYTTDAARRIVTIKPMASKTWYMNLGNRRATFTVGGTTGTSTTGSTASVSSGSASASASSVAQPVGSLGSLTVGSTDEFWTSLKTELDARLTVMMPENRGGQPPASSTLTLPPPTLQPAAIPGLPPPGQPAAAGTPAAASIPLPPSAPAATVNPPAATSNSPSDQNNQLFVPRKVGTFSLNPETGAIYVQAPHWVLEQLDTYFKRVQAMYNVDLTFSGELIMLNAENGRSEGLDISSFARFANNRYGVAYANNTLGGVTLSFPTNGSLIPSFTGDGTQIAKAMLGVVSPLDGLAVLNAYLSNVGTVSILQKPVLTTTSGVPADFRRTVTRYYNTVNQQAAAGGTGSASTATQNTLVPIELGSILRINPRIDLSTGLIRAQIVLEQLTQSGTQNIQQSLSAGSSVQQVATQVPVITRVVYQGEALLKDGDLLVMGGQTEEGTDVQQDGITGTMDTPVAGLFGTKKQTKNGGVFYFALKVGVKARQ